MLSAFGGQTDWIRIQIHFLILSLVAFCLSAGEDGSDEGTSSISQVRLRINSSYNSSIIFHWLSGSCPSVGRRTLFLLSSARRAHLNVIWGFDPEPRSLAFPTSSRLIALSSEDIPLVLPFLKLCRSTNNSCSNLSYQSVYHTFVTFSCGVVIVQFITRGLFGLVSVQLIA